MGDWFDTIVEAGTDYYENQNSGSGTTPNGTNTGGISTNTVLVIGAVILAIVLLK